MPAGHGKETVGSQGKALVSWQIPGLKISVRYGKIIKIVSFCPDFCQETHPGGCRFSGATERTLEEGTGEAMISCGFSGDIGRTLEKKTGESMNHAGRVVIPKKCRQRIDRKKQK